MTVSWMTMNGMNEHLSDYVDKRFPDLEENEREEWIKNHARK